MRKKLQKIFELFILSALAFGYRDFEESHLDTRKINPSETKISYNATILKSVGIALVRNSNENQVVIRKESWHPIKLVYRLPNLSEFVIKSCPKELHTTLQSRMDNDDGLQELIKEADSLKSQFLHELMSHEPFIAQRKRRNTTVDNPTNATTPGKTRTQRVTHNDEVGTNKDNPRTTNSEWSDSSLSEIYASKTSSNSEFRDSENYSADSYSGNDPAMLYAETTEQTTTDQKALLPTYPASSTVPTTEKPEKTENEAEKYEPSGFCGYEITEQTNDALRYFKDECNTDLTICCNQLTCPTANLRTGAAKMVSEMISYQNSTLSIEEKSNLSDTMVCFRGQPGRSKKSLGFWRYWSRGGALTPTSINSEIEQVEELENDQIHALSEKMLSKEVFSAAIESEESKLKLLSATLCTVSTQLLGTSKITEMRNHYITLEEKIETAVSQCEQGNRPMGLSTRLLISLCMRLNPNDDRFCRDPTVLSKINCKAVKLDINENEIVFHLQIGMFEFVEDSVSTQIVATPFIDQSGRSFIITDIPRNIVETHHHIISTTCETGIGDSISICSLRNSIDVNANLACVNALLTKSKNLIKLSCKKTAYRGDKCIAYGIENGGFIVWATKPISVRAISREKSFSKTLKVTKSNDLTIISERNIEFECNSIKYQTANDVREITYSADSKIDIDLAAKNIVSDEFGLFSDRLTELQKAQEESHKNATKLATSQLSRLFNVSVKHESKITYILRSIVIIVIIASLIYFLKKFGKICLRKYGTYRNRRYRAFLDIIRSDRTEDSISPRVSPEVITTQPQNTRI
jgi:hypothetical protein